MTRHLKPMFVYPALAAMLFGFIYFFTGGYAAGLGISPTIGSDLMAVLPGLFIVVIGTLFIAGLAGRQFAVIGFGAWGIGLSILFQEMFDAGIIDASLLAGASIAQLQTITIIVSIVMGGVAYSAGNR
jgi:hypothetical protein